MSKQPRVAIVADWIIGGGAERVVEQLHALYPDAPIYASYCSDEWRQKLDDKVITGWLQHWPFGALRKYIGVLRIIYYKQLNLKEFDTVISCTGNGEAKFVQVSGSAKHICYCFTPTHYYWRHYQTYIDNPGFGMFNSIARLGLKILVNPLRNLDYKAAQKPNQMVAISEHIQRDIKQYYDRDSIIIHPPVDTERFSGTSKAKRAGYITLGRQTAYKHTDIIVEACNQLDLPLSVVGRGPEHDKLVSMAGPKTTFFDSASDEQVNEMLKQAKGFIFAAEEDFGIAPVEAIASGTPVIAYNKGGARDFIKPGNNGLLFESQTAESLVEAIQEFEKLDFINSKVAATAEEFSAKSFKTKISELVSN